MPLTRHWKLDDNAANTTVVGTVGANGTLVGDDNTQDKHVSTGGIGPAGAIVSAFDLNGTDDAVSFSGVDLSEGSFSIWFYLDAVPAPLCGGTSGSAETIRVIDDTHVGARMNVTELSFTVPSLGTGTWHHLVWTRDVLTVHRMYIDGVESSTGGQTQTLNTLAPNRLGRSGTDFFNGRIADARFYDHALSQQEIDDLFDGSGAGGEITHFCGIGATTDTTTKYKCRVDKVGATLQIEYGTASDLSGSTTSTGVTVGNTNDRVNEEEITGLTADTLYYYSIKIDGTRKHSSPFPTFRTFPAAGSNADVKILFGSCQNSPTESTIFPAMAGEGAHLLIHLGDFAYIDATDTVSQITGYRSMYTSDFLTSVVQKMARAHTWDDHDYATNNSHGDTSGKANSLAVFKSYHCSHALANAAAGVWRKFTIANAEVFVLDCRYQREGTKLRFPASSTNTADTGSGGTSLVLRSADSPSGTDDNYNGWYVETEGVVRRVTDYVGSTRTCTLSASVPGLDDASTYYLRKASFFDQDFIADDQVDWIISSVNGSGRLWKIIASSTVMHPNGGSTDTIGGWDTDQVEWKYLRQEITADNVVVISGDRHGAAIDDGTNAGWPEATVSPFNQADIGVSGTWSQGIDNTGHKYGVIEIDASAGTLTLTSRNADGTTTAGITPLVIDAVGGGSILPLVACDMANIADLCGMRG